MAAHVCSKNEFTEDEKCHYLMRWLIIVYDAQMGNLCGNILLSFHICVFAFRHVLDASVGGKYVITFCLFSMKKNNLLIKYIKTDVSCIRDEAVTG